MSRWDKDHCSECGNRLSTVQDMVNEFHERFGVPILPTPTIPPEDRVRLRKTLIAEEFSEVLDADHLEEIADGLADLVYVCYGAALEFGIDLDAVLAEVHASNMRKVGGPTRADGKIGKPEGWRPPDVAGVLARQGRLR